MSVTYESGKITSLLNQEITLVSFSNTYSQPPVVKITCDSNINIYIQNITTSQFEIVKNSNEEITVHYIVIER
jgi:hypothetical protein